MPAFAPTPEQESIFEGLTSSSDSLMIDALAGCAKTTTIEQGAKALKPQPVLALAFNVKIKQELEKKLPSHFAVKTLNGLGHSAWSQAIGKRLIIDDRKLGRLVTVSAKASGADLPSDQWDEIRRLASLAQSRGLVPAKYLSRASPILQDTEENWVELAEELGIWGVSGLTIDLARTSLEANIQEGYGGVVSFDDQIYLSALFGGVFPRFPMVIVDEAQDLSPLNHIQLSRSSAGRLVAVGDPRQAIYQFRGADSKSMGNIRKLKLEWSDFPLATTFRCPKIVVSRQLHHAPHFTAWHTNPEGQFLELGKEWMLPDAPELAILCRNNAPLVAMAFKLIRRGIGCQMLGRDIGKNLTTLVKKIIPDLTSNITLCASLITEWETREIALATANRKESKISGILDRSESLQAVIEFSNANDGHGIIRAIESLFTNNNTKIVLATGHKSKGLEFHTVIHLDPWRIPSKFALAAANNGNPSQLEQEKNLKYVIETRAKHTLCEANLENFK